MDFKKCICIFLIVIFTICVLSSVQATSDSTKTNIGGIDFNIPAGYEKSNYSDENNVSVVNGIETVSNILIYSGSDGVFSISTIDFNQDIKEGVNDNGEKTTIKNIDGYLEKKDDKYLFHFNKNDTAVTISVPDKDLIEKIIV